MISSESVYESESTDGEGGIPGTDSNDGEDLTTYVNPDYSNSESSQS
jgi:hypothetical protein